MCGTETTFGQLVRALTPVAHGRPERGHLRRTSPRSSTVPVAVPVTGAGAVTTSSDGRRAIGGRCCATGRAVRGRARRVLAEERGRVAAPVRGPGRLSVQFVSPTRRWRPRLPRRANRAPTHEASVKPASTDPPRARRRSSRPPTCPPTPGRPAATARSAAARRPGGAGARIAAACGCGGSSAGWLALAAVARGGTRPVDGRALRPHRVGSARRRRDPRARGAGAARAAVRARPSLGETALAVDARGALGDRVSSALELAVGFPASAGPADDVRRTRRSDRSTKPPRPTGSSAASVRDALSAAPRRTARPLPAAVLAATGRRRRRGRPAPRAGPAVPNPQDAVIAQQHQVARRPSARPSGSTRSPEELDSKGADANDPRTQARGGAARPRPPAAGAARRASTSTWRGSAPSRARSARADRSRQRAARRLARLAEPGSVARRDRQARGEPRWRSRGDRARTSSELSTSSTR